MNALQRWNQQMNNYKDMMAGLDQAFANYTNAEPPFPIPRGCAFCDEDGPHDLVEHLPNGDTITLFVCGAHRGPPKE